MKCKKIVKFIGNILVVLSLLFIIKKFAEFRVDLLSVLSPINIFYLIFISIAYSIISVFQSYAWKRTVNLTANVRIPWLEIIKTYVQANLMKYLPGNIMHFVGRNELAVRFELNHVEVALSTVIDTVVSLAASVIIAVFFYYHGIRSVLQKYQLNYKLLIFGGAMAFSILLVLLFLRKKMKSVDLMFYHVFSGRGVWIVLTNLLFYIGTGIATSFLYVLILVKVVGQVANFPVGIVLGAVSLSSMIGFITPGAPGGIGVREAVMSILLADYLDVPNALLAIVLFRGISVIGDLVSFLTVQVYVKIKQKRLCR